MNQDVKPDEQGTQLNPDNAQQLDSTSGTPPVDADKAAKEAKKRVAKQVKARVLIAGTYGKVNDVVLLDGPVAKSGEEAGELDSGDAAVAYAESLKN